MRGLVNQGQISSIKNYTCTTPDGQLHNTNSSNPFKDFQCCDVLNGKYYLQGNSQ
eukprot:Pgem_evm1s12406